MATPLTVKRRRLNETAGSVTRPFVSPFRGSQAPARLEDNCRADQNLHESSVLVPAIQTTHGKATTSPTASKVSFSSTAQAHSSQRRQGLLLSSISKDPAEQAAQRALTALELQIRSVKKELDTLKQAARIDSLDSDADLERLTYKWTSASRAAAEELFGTVKERVYRMGGVVAWRENEKEKYERSHALGKFAESAQENDADCEFDSQGEELPIEEQEYRKQLKRQAQQELSDAADVGQEVAEQGDARTPIWREPGRDDDAFTMDMMLRSLNIDLHVIGYDKAAQCWLD